MLLRTAAVLLVCIIYVVTAAEDCSKASTYLQSIFPQQSSSDLTFSSPTSQSSNKCRLDRTCCTGTAEQLLGNRVESSYQTSLFNKLNSTLFTCINTSSSSLQSTTAEFIDNAKAFAISTISGNVGSTFTIDEAIFDDFYDYLKNGVRQLDIASIQQKFQTVYFKIFLATFREILKANDNQVLITTSTFETCFYSEVFSKYFGSGMKTDYDRLEERFNLYLRYIWALETGDKVLKTILSHSLSSNCRDSLLRMDHCSHCSATPTNSLACHSMCLNTLRGCFVDFASLADALQKYIDALDSAKDRLNSFNPFASVSLLNSRLNSLVSQTESNFATIKSFASIYCQAQYTSAKRRRRSTPSTSSHSRSKRQSDQEPLNALAESASCLMNAPNALKTLSRDICSESTTVSKVDYNCWNGSATDSYWWEVRDISRLDQATNPELNIEADTGLLYKTAIGQLNIVANDLDQCQDDVRDCTVKLSSFTVPDGDQYDFGNSAEFQSFTELGFPDPVIVSNVPVAPALSTIPTTTTTTAPRSISTSSQTPPSMVPSPQRSSSVDIQEVSTPPSSRHSTPLPIVTSTTSIIVRPSTIPTTSTVTRPPVRPPVPSSTPTRQSTAVGGFIPEETGIPDPDKAKLNSGGQLVTASIFVIYLLSSIVLLVVLLL